MATYDAAALSTKPKGVCLLVTDIDGPSGGIQRNSRLLLEELGRRGVATYVCARNYYRRSATEHIGGTTFRRSPVLGRNLAVNGLLYFITALLWLLLNRRKYDVIHCQQMFGPTMVAAVASFLVGKPILTRVTTVGDLGEVKQIKEMPLSAVRLWLIGKVSRWAVLTREMRKELATLGIHDERISVIPNATSIPAAFAYSPEVRSALRQKLDLGSEPVAVFVGRLSEEKNLDVLLEAWSPVRDQVRGAQLLIIGAGGAYRNCEQSLRELVKRLDLGRSVRFLGHRDDAQQFVLASDAFILPSRTEGMSNALVEACACGAAIVATDIPGNAEICVHRENSLLVPVGDASALATAILEIFRSPELGHRLGAAARRKAEADLSIEVMIARYLDAYAAILPEAI